jgi:hypothetical protein
MVEKPQKLFFHVSRGSTAMENGQLSQNITRKYLFRNGIQASFCFGPILVLVVSL